MQTYQVVVGVVSLILVAAVQVRSSGVNWNSLTAEQLHALDPSAFASITGEQIYLINETACPGFRSDQMRAIPARSYSSFQNNQFSSLPDEALSNITAEQLGNFQYYIFYSSTPSKVGSIPSEAASGWTYNQLDQLSQGTSACSGLTAAQVANILLSSFGGFDGSCLGWFQDTAFSQISADKFRMVLSKLQYFSVEKFHNLSPAAFSVWSPAQTSTWAPQYCSVITEPQLAALVPSAFQALSLDCINATQGFVWGSVSITQIQALSLPAFAALPIGAVFNLQESVVQSLTIDQFSQLTANSVAGLGRADLMFQLYSRFGMSLVNLYGADKYASFSPQSMATFKAHAITPSIPQPNSWANVTWIQFSLLSSTSSPVPSTFWNQIPASTIGGIRPDQVQTRFQPGFIFRLMRDNQGSYLAPDTLAAMSVDQLTNILPVVFTNIPSYSIAALPISSWLALLPEQLKTLSNSTIMALNCALVQGTTSTQTQAFSDDQNAAYYQRLYECASPTTGAASSSSTSPYKSSSTTTSQATNKNTGNSGTVILGVVLGLMCIVTGVVGFFIGRRYSKKNDYAHLSQQI